MPREVIRLTTTGGDLHYSKRFQNERGGNQGTVLMPLTFILLTHYVYLRGDPHRHHILGVISTHDCGEALSSTHKCRILFSSVP